MESIGSILAGQNGQAEKSKTSLGADFDTFLTLLTTQLQMQDPLDPLDSNEFTSQLVQFTNVEQQIQQNKNLENIATLSAINALNASVGFIGKDAVVEQPLSTLSNGSVNWLYALDGKSQDTMLVVKNSAGAKVFETAGSLDTGTHSFTWDGIDANGNQMPDGIYTLNVETKNAQDVAVPTHVYMKDKVNAVDFQGGDSLLDIGGFSVPMGLVVSLREPQAPPV